MNVDKLNSISMKLLYCTQKLLKKFSKISTELDDSLCRKSTQGLGNWYANVFIANRKTHLIFVNEKTLYSFVIPEVRKNIFQNIHSAFLNHLELHLVYENIDRKVIQKILAEYDSFIITKTINKSVLGCMRDIVYHFQYDFCSYPKMTDEELFSITQKNNTIPHKIKDWVFPIDLLMEVILKKYF